MVVFIILLKTQIPVTLCAILGGTSDKGMEDMYFGHTSLTVRVKTF